MSVDSWLKLGLKCANGLVVCLFVSINNNNIIIL